MGRALFLLVVFLQPAAKAVGPAAGPFMRELLVERHLTDWILRIAGATIVAGGFLYWHDVQAFGSLGDFLDSAFGLWLTIGRSRRSSRSRSVGPSPDRPSSARSRSAPRSPRRATRRLPSWCRSSEAGLAKLALALVTISAFAMSTARYW